MPSRGRDPVLRNAAREATAVMVLWAAALAWTVGYCYFNAYGRSIDSLTYVWGFPDWIFYGVVAPWLACTVFTLVFCLGVMTDDDWGEECDSESASPDAPIAEAAAAPTPSAGSPGEGSSDA
ncbi:MAG TPA: DUF997 family protein [Pirellulales bacterium]